jgi:hypothetical protein
MMCSRFFFLLSFCYANRFRNQRTTDRRAIEIGKKKSIGQLKGRPVILLFVHARSRQDPRRDRTDRKDKAGRIEKKGREHNVSLKGTFYVYVSN